MFLLILMTQTPIWEIWNMTHDYDVIHVNMTPPDVHDNTPIDHERKQIIIFIAPFLIHLMQDEPFLSNIHSRPQGQFLCCILILHNLLNLDPVHVHFSAIQCNVTPIPIQ